MLLSREATFEGDADGRGAAAPDLLRRLRRDILHGVLPPAERLSIEGLQRRYGGSANTLRHALGELLAENLVTTWGRRSFQVAPISLTDLADVMRMRQLIETEALKGSIANGDEAWEGRLVSAFHTLSKLDWADEDGRYAEEWESRHRHFHRTLNGACGSFWLLRQSELFYDLNARYRHLSLTRLDLSPRDHLREHADIMQAALDRDVAAATTLISTHMSKTAILMLERGIASLPVETGESGDEAAARRFLNGELARAGLAAVDGL